MSGWLFLLPFLKRAFLLVVPICLLGLTSCYSEKERPIESFHPIWSALNEGEDNIAKDKCLVTKLGWERLRFHVADHQKCLNTVHTDCGLKCKNSIVESSSQVVSWVLTPDFYGSVTSEKFPKTIAANIKHRHNGREYGMPVAFLAELLALGDSHKEAIVVISTGMEGKLGVSESLKDALKQKKEAGEIYEYHIQNTIASVRRHNAYVKRGKKVFTFIHTAG